MDRLTELLESIFHLLGPWPSTFLALAIVVVVLVLIALFASSIRLGPLAIELRRTTRELDELSLAMAESRIVELEIAARQPLLGTQDSELLREQTGALRSIVDGMRRKRRS